MMASLIEPWDHIRAAVPVRRRRVIFVIEDGGHLLATTLGAFGAGVYADGLLRNPTVRQAAATDSNLWPWFWFVVAAMFLVSSGIQIAASQWRVGPYRVRASTISTLIASAAFLAVAAGRAWLWWSDGDGFESRSIWGIWVAVCAPLVLVISGTLSIVLRSMSNEDATQHGHPPR